MNDSTTMVSMALLFLVGSLHVSGGGNLPAVELHQAACGAVLRDDFNSPTINTALWTASSADPGIRVGVDQGELCIRGKSAEIADSVLRRNLGVLAHYAGLYSKVLPQVDVALAVRVKMPSGISEDPGAHVVNVHLCGVDPDCYPEVLFGKCESRPMERLIKEYAGIDRPYQSARGWWFAIVDQVPGGYWWRFSGEPLAEQRDEREQFHDVLVDYDEQTRLSRGFVKIGARWIQLGQPETVIRGATKVELKVTNVTAHHGTYREARFDDCRLYPNPRRHPARLVVKTGSAPYAGKRLRAALYTADGLHKVSESHTDHQGIAYLPVESPHWTAFPVSAVLRFYLGEAELANAFIRAQGVEGLYPADVWVLDTREIPGLQSR